ncbi:MarR family winged helix-turn-helix transcriptional regulator [Nocardioides bruguierae]|uniref:MarR family winged helix-turn-helix transcriptional regulator n=1 Tax=Nocardioides bruguierae TaxID=2945102 RepID=UPI0020212F5E|nr:MarR family transcriptional regulator [Nocardioides bruguierae]MCL8026900.1 MarR family transcriptional regulator [Nocardioides bruguierae]
MTEQPQDHAVTWAALDALHCTVSAAVADALSATGPVTLEEYSVMRLLAARGCSQLRMSAVAEAARLSNSGATRLVSRLSERGLVSRQVCDDDRRAVLTGLTPTGQQVLEDLDVAVSAATQKSVADFSTTDLRDLGAALVGLFPSPTAGLSLRR